MVSNKNELLKKGWKEEEIKNAEKILDRANAHDVFFSKIVFWSALIVIVFANVLVSIVLIPFVIVLNSWVLYVTVALFGLVIGFLYNFLITDIGLLEKKHHRTASVIVPIIGLGNTIAMVLLANRFITNLELINNLPQNPWLIGASFGVAFVIPYIIDSLRRSRKS